MFPISDEDSRPGSAAPVVAALVAINVGIFIWEMQVSTDEALRYAVRPQLLLAEPGDYWYTVITSMFLHGSWMHLLGNMLFLYIFADNIEDLLGSAPFLLFYLLCGVGAMAAQVLMDRTSMVPILGASGAVSGVMGAYVLAFPHNRVRCLYWVVFFVGLVWVPAAIFLGIWFLLQLVNALGSHGGGGVAFAAHVGGFVCGMLLLKTFPHNKAALDFYNWRNSLDPIPRGEGDGGGGP